MNVIRCGWVFDKSRMQSQADTYQCRRKGVHKQVTPEDKRHHYKESVRFLCVPHWEDLQQIQQITPVRHD